MSAMRESPFRPRTSKAGPPRWLVVLLVIVGVLVAGGVIYAIVALTGSSSSDTPQAEASSAPCVTTTSIPQETLPAAKKVKVRVLNATDKSGLARKAADALSESGFKIVDVGNDTDVRKQTGVAEIRYGPRARVQALLLQYYLPGAELVPNTKKSRVVDLALGEAFTKVATQAEADLALTTPVVTTAGAGCPSATSASGESQASQPAAPTVAGGASSE